MDFVVFTVAVALKKICRRRCIVTGSILFVRLLFCRLEISKASEALGGRGLYAILLTKTFCVFYRRSLNKYD